MEVYIEYALAENFILDATLLYLALKTVRLTIEKGRIFLAAFIGAILAVLFPLIPLNGISAFIARYLFGVILCLIATQAKKVKEYLLVVAFFYLYTFAFGGLLLGAYALFQPKISVEGNYTISQTPVTIVLVGACVFAVGIVKIFTLLYKKYRRKKLLYRCEISFNGEKIEGIGLLDTGNGLTCEGIPVCLIDKSLTAGIEIPRYEEKTLFVHTATGGGELKIFQAQLQIYSEEKKNIIDKVYFALAPAALGKGYQIILQPQLFKEDAPC